MGKQNSGLHPKPGPTVLCSLRESSTRKATQYLAWGHCNSLPKLVRNIQRTRGRASPLQVLVLRILEGSGPCLGVAVATLSLPSVFEGRSHRIAPQPLLSGVDILGYLIVIEKDGDDLG